MRALRPNQRVALRYTFGVAHPLLFMEMRLGKTLVAIRRIKTYSPCRFILVVGPYSVLAGWRDDLESDGEWDIWDLTGNYSPGERMNRLEAMKLTTAKRSWALMNKEAHMSIPQVAGFAWDTVVVDESIILKNPQAQITVFFNKYFRRVPHRWVLCGTPNPESDLDFVCQLNFANPRILGMSYYRIRARYFHPSDRDAHDWRISSEGRAWLSDRLSRFGFFQSRAEVHMGGVKIRERRMVKLPAAVRKIYNTVEAEFLLEIDGKVVDKTVWASQKYIWLKRLCGGWLPGETSEHKLDELFSLLRGELKGEQTLIWAQLRWEIELLAEMIPGAAVIHGDISPQKREEARAGFQCGRFQHAIIQPETMKFGSKWTAASALIYYSSPESATTREQTEDRALDVASQDSMLIIDLPCEDTIEEDILMNLIWKESRSEGMERLVKAIQKRRRG